MATIPKDAEIRATLEKIKELDKQREYLYKIIDSLEDQKAQNKIKTKFLTPNMIKGKPTQQYLWGLDTMTEGMEGTYYWLLAFLGETYYTKGYKVNKAQDYFAATETSFFFGEMGARRTNLEKRAQELLGLINQLVRTMINILWDLREFDIRLNHYKKLEDKDAEIRRSADLALKSIWLSEVDMKKGAGSINNLVQQLNFVTLRDAFMFVDTLGDEGEILKKIGEKENEGMDLPLIVKRILRARAQEYLQWRELSRQELTKRFEIEKAYLRHEVASLKLYTEWAKPYLYATQKLIPAEQKKLGKTGAPLINVSVISQVQAELVTAFETAHIFIELFGTKDVTPKPGGEEIFGDDKIYQAIEIDFIYRTLPGQVERSRYMQRGNLDVVFSAYALDERRKKDLETVEQVDVLKLATQMTDDTLAKLSKDLADFGAVDVEDELPDIAIAKSGLGTFAQDVVQPFADAAKNLKKLMPEQTGPSPRTKDMALKAAAKSARGDILNMYDTLKKAKRMYTW